MSDDLNLADLRAWADDPKQSPEREGRMVLALIDRVEAAEAERDCAVESLEKFLVINSHNKSASMNRQAQNIVDEMNLLTLREKLGAAEVEIERLILALQRSGQ